MTAPRYIAPLLLGTDDPYADDLNLLATKLDRENIEYDRVDRYYSGDQPLAFMAPEVTAQLGDRLAPLVINWPEVIVDSVNRRVRDEGFRLGQGGETDDELWRIWTANELDEESPLGNADALVHGISFLSVWGNEEDPQTPLMAFESAHQVTVDYAPGNRTVRAALKRWRDGDDTFATLYLPTQVRKYVSRNSVAIKQSRWELREAPIPNTLGAVPIVPMVNRGRLLNRSGRSELASVAPIADGINKMATDLLVTSEYFVSPRRWATGIQVPGGDPADRERLQAEATAYWDKATKGKTWLAGEGVNFGQFPEATLDGFVKGINLLTSALAAVGGLPPDDLGLNTTNPASAAARRAAETTLILRAKEKWGPFGGARVRAMRLAIAARDGITLAEVPQDYKRMQVAWADPGSPAIAEEMDAAVKGTTAGIYDIEAAQQLVGMSPVERSAMKARAAAVATADVRARMDLARELMASDGLTLNAAMAAVGLMQAAATNSAESGPSTAQSA